MGRALARLGMAAQTAVRQETLLSTTRGLFASVLRSSSLDAALFDMAETARRVAGLDAVEYRFYGHQGCLSGTAGTLAEGLVPFGAAVMDAGEWGRETLTGLCSPIHGDLGAAQTVLTHCAALAGCAVEAIRRVESIRVSAERLENASVSRSAEPHPDEARLRDLDEMAAQIAHIFNNLLAGILGRAQLMLKRPDDTEKITTGLQTIEQTVLKGKQIIRHLQLASQPDPVAPDGPVALDVLIAQVAAEQSATGKTSSVDIVVDLPSEGVWVSGREEEIHLMLTQIALNTLEAMPGGGQLSMTLRSGPDGATVEVTDTGPGIPETLLSRIFDPLFTTRGPQSAGLGLSLARTVMRRHGGTIDMASVSGKGARVTMRFPLSYEGPAGAMPPPCQWTFFYRTHAGARMNIRVEQTSPATVHQITDMAGRINELEAVNQTLRRQLEEARLQLFQANKVSVVGQMVATVAHDLNNPLNGILGYSQLMIKRTTDETARTGLQKIESEAQRATHIVQTLLAFVRDHKPEKQSIQLNDIIAHMAELRAHHRMINHIDLSLGLESDLPMLIAEPHQIGQVVLNLLSNAEQAIAGSAVRGAIRITSEVSSDGRQPIVRIRIRDNGPGIATDLLPRIFEPFFTTKTAGQGTGLGLSICRQIVEEHEGRLSVESQTGNGATFTIDLPVTDEPHFAPSVPGPAKPSAPSVPPSRGLVIDDELVVREFVNETFTSEGHCIDAAANGREAFEALKCNHYDFIICDLRMPEVNGQTFYDLVKSFDERLSRRIIFITGDTANANTHRFSRKRATTVSTSLFNSTI